MTPARFDPERLLLYDGFARDIARALVADTNAADDIAQQAVIRAHYRMPDRVQSWRGWLRTVVGNLAANSRREAMRRRRIEGAAPNLDTEPGAAPSAAEVHEREAARQAVVAATLALTEPYRTTILRRYFENQSPRRIARDLGVPVQTVYTRTKRGLSLLRDRLAARPHEEHHRGLAMLAQLPAATPLTAPLTSASAPSATASNALHAWTMSTKLRTLIVGIVLISAATILYWSSVGPPAVQRERTVDRDGPSDTNSAPAFASEVADPTSLDRSALPIADDSRDPRSADATSGDVRVRITWATDGERATGIGVAIWNRRRPQSFIDTSTHRTDARGEVVFSAIPAGLATVLIDRGGSTDVQVAPERTVTVDLTLPAGTAVACRVVDPHGEPIVGAAVFLGRPAATASLALVGHTGPKGTIEVRGVPAGAGVGAAHPGFVPSSMYFPGAPDQVITIQLRRGLPPIPGRVEDARGNPVPGAFIAATWGLDAGTSPGARSVDADGNKVFARPTLRIEADDEGRFEIANALPTILALRAYAAPLAASSAIFNLQEKVPGELVLTLDDPCEVAGLVRSDHGEPIAGAEIGDGTIGLGAARTKTAADGSFHLAGLPRQSAVTLIARASGFAEVRQRVPLSRDGRGQTSIQMTACGFVRGRVLGRRARPWPKGQIVLVDLEKPREQQKTTTGLDGRFGFPRTPLRPQRLEVWEAGHIAPSAVTQIDDPRRFAPVEIQLPDTANIGAVRGRILNGAGTPASGVVVSARSTSFPRVVTVITGPDGCYSVTTGIDTHLTISASPLDRSLRTVAEVSVGANEERDLGDFTLQLGGRVVFVADASVRHLELRVVAADGRERVIPPHEVRRPLILAAQRYTVYAESRSAAAVAVPLVVVDGQNIKLEIPTVPGFRREFRIQSPRGRARGLRWHIHSTAADPQALPIFAGPTEYFDPQGNARLRVTLAPGNYRITGRARDGQLWSTEFRVRPEESTTPLDLVMR